MTTNSTRLVNRTWLAAAIVSALICFVNPQTAFAQQWTTTGNDISNANSGNVGVGTSTPIYKFDVLSTTNILGRFSSTAAANNQLLINAPSGFNSNLTLQHAGLNKWYLGNRAANDRFSFVNAGGSVEVFSILQNGNVGIGTTAPNNAKLHLFSGASGATEYTLGGAPELTLESGLNTDLYFLSPNTGSARIWFGSPASNIAGGIMYFHNATPANGYMYFAAGNNVERMRIQGNGNIGIGTTAPASKLEVAGTIHSTTGGFKFPDGSLQTTAASGGGGGSVSSVFGRTGAVVAATNDYTWAQINKSAANAGDLAAGTLLAARMPALTGDVTTSVGTVATTLSNTGVTAGSYTNANITVNSKGRITAASNGSGGSTAFSDITAGTNTVALLVSGSLGVSGTGTINATSLTNAANITSGTVPTARLGSGTANNTTFLRGDNTWTALTSSQWTTNGTSINYAPAGNVGIGVTGTPAEKLHVTGNGKFTGNLTVDGSINAKYQDLAEWVPSSEQLAAGTVVVLDTTKSNQVISSKVGYDTRVAGVISAQPGITLGEGGEGKALVATTGRVRVKVDASRSAIQIGDLLVTSDVAGLAMKSEAVNLGGVQIHRPGTIIGKALEPLTKGSGEILVLLSLQ